VRYGDPAGPLFIVAKGSLTATTPNLRRRSDFEKSSTSTSTERSTSLGSSPLGRIAPSPEEAAALPRHSSDLNVLKLPGSEQSFKVPSGLTTPGYVEVEVHTNQYAHGDYFGEVSALKAVARRANIVAKGQCYGYMLPLEQVLDSPDPILDYMRGCMAVAQLHSVPRTFLNSSEIFKDCTEDELWDIAYFMIPEVVGSLPSPKSKKVKNPKEAPETNLILQASTEEIPLADRAIYFVQEGVIELSALGHGTHRQAEPACLRRVLRGEYFGVESMVLPKRGHALDARPIGKVKLLRFIWDGFTKLPDALKRKLEEEVANSPSSKFVGLLEEISLLRGIEPLLLRAVCWLVESFTCSAGSQLACEGKAAAGWHILLEGEAEAHCTTSHITGMEKMLAAGHDGTKPHHLTTYRAHDSPSFGEVEMLLGVPSKATVVAKSDCELLLVSAEHWARVPECIKERLKQRVQQHNDAEQALKERIHTAREEQRRFKENRMQGVLGLLEQGKLEVAVQRFLLAHARECRLRGRCSLGIHCEGSKKRLSQLESHSASCLAMDKSLCQKCSLHASVVGIGEDEALAMLEAERDAAGLSVA